MTNQTTDQPESTPTNQTNSTSGSTTLLCGDVEVDEGVYHWACFFVAATELRNKGLIKGGPDVDLDMMKAIKTVGERGGLRAPNSDEMQAMTHYMMRGGEWEREQMQTA